jgi:hypothetical protein
MVNKYAGKCKRCKVQVPAGAGLIQKEWNGWCSDWVVYCLEHHPESVRLAEPVVEIEMFEAPLFNEAGRQVRGRGNYVMPALDKVIRAINSPAMKEATRRLLGDRSNAVGMGHYIDGQVIIFEYHPEKRSCWKFLKYRD